MTGGCTCKLDPNILNRILKKIPKKSDPNLLIGYDSSDDAAVYKLTENLALVETLDFFTKVVEDPYDFGKIAATNALSDVFAMGGEVKLALSIACFPEKSDPEILTQVLKGGAEKVHEAGGVLCGGHTVNDNDMKFGLAVTGIIDPTKILANNNCVIKDKIILTKPLGVGIVTTAYNVSEGTEDSFKEAVFQMQYLNKYARDIMIKYNVNACTDVTGFGFLGHLNEMVKDDYSIRVNSKNIPFIKDADLFAKEFLITAGGQKNRNFLKDKVMLNDISFEIQEILFDPQTSGGLLISVAEQDAEKLLEELNALEIKSSIVAEVIERKEKNIIVSG